jgi:integrase
MSAYRERDPKTGKSYWRVDITWQHADGRVQRVRKVSPIQTRRGAEDYEREIRNALADGTWGKRRKDDAPTLASYREKYFTQHVATLKASTRDSHRAIWDTHLVPAFGHRKISTFSDEDVAKFKARLLGELAPKTANNVLSAMRTALDKAADWKLIDRSAVPSFEWAKVEEQGFDFFTFAEAEQIVLAMPIDDQPWSAMIQFALNTGLRLGELRSLRRADIDRDQRLVRVQRSVWKAIEAGTKNNRIRTVPLNASAIFALDQIEKRKGSELVFAGDKGKPLTKEQCKWPLWRACDRAGVGRRVGWHVLRHTFASHLAMRAVPIVTIQKLLGHATIQMTMRYAHLAPEYLRDAVLALERPDSAQ